MFPCKISLPSTLGFSQHVLKNARELQKNRFLCDAELVANDGGVVPIHLEVVRTYMPGKFENKKSSEKFDVRTAHLDVLVSLMYGANVSLNDLSEALDLLQAAISTGSIRLVQELVHLLENHALEENLPFSLWSFARKHQVLEQLNSACLRAAALQFSTLWQQSRNDLLALPMSDLLKLLSHPLLVVAAEEEICDLIVAKCSQISPEECLASLVRCVRLNLVTRSPIFGKEAPRTLRLAEYIVRAEMMLKSTMGLAEVMPKSPRLPLDFLFCVGSSIGTGFKLQLAAFDMRRNSWQRIANHKVLYGKHICHALERPHRKTQIILLIKNMESCAVEVFSLDIRSGNLLELSTLDLPVDSMSDHHLVHLKEDNLAIFSFFRVGEASVEIRRYEEARNEWTLVKSLVEAEMPHLQRPRLSRVKDELYLTGGYNTILREYSSHVYFFNEPLLAFTRIGSMASARHNHTACEFGGKLVVSGGWPTTPVNTTETLEVFPTHTTTISAVEYPRMPFRLLMNNCDKTLVVCEHYDSSPIFKVLEPSSGIYPLPRLFGFRSVDGLVNIPTRNLNDLLASESKVVSTAPKETNQDLCMLTFCYNAGMLFMRLFHS